MLDFLDLILMLILAKPSHQLEGFPEYHPEISVAKQVDPLATIVIGLHFNLAECDLTSASLLALT